MRCVLFLFTMLVLLGVLVLGGCGGSSNGGFEAAQIAPTPEEREADLTPLEPVSSVAGLPAQIGPAEASVPKVNTYSPRGTANLTTYPVIVTFSEGMARVSVQNNFVVDPARAGTFSWVGRTLKFTPNNPWRPGVRYRITIKAAARSALNVPLGKAFTWTFTTHRPLDFTKAAGNWTGPWHNTTFDSSGTCSMKVTVNTGAKTVKAVVTLTGNVFGSPAPLPFTLNGSYTAKALTFPPKATLIGTVAATIKSDGRLNATITDIPGGALSKVTVVGVVTDNKIDGKYTVDFSGGGTAAGTMVMNKT